MNYFDIFFTILCLYFVIKGMMRGFVGEVISLVGFFASFYLAPLLSVPVGRMLAQSMNISIYIAEVIGVVLVWIAVMLVFAIIRMIVSRFIGAVHLGAVNRILGAFSGFIKASVFIYVIIMCGLLLTPVVSPVWLSESSAISFAGRYWPEVRSLAVGIGVLPHDTNLPDGTLNQILRPYRNGSDGPGRD
ncbi:MAG: CvpA family protein [Synergistes sp.]|nr:CvpA family protein [Synergistes sp.]